MNKMSTKQIVVEHAITYSTTSDLASTTHSKICTRREEDDHLRGWSQFSSVPCMLPTPTSAQHAMIADELEK
jgi:hypothetical protein